MRVVRAERGERDRGVTHRPARWVRGGAHVQSRAHRLLRGVLRGVHRLANFEFRLYEKCHRARAVGDHHHLSDVHHAIGDSVLSRRARDTARGTNFASATRLRELGGARGLNVIFNVQ